MIKLVALKFVHFFITVAQIAFSAFLWLQCLLKDVRASAFGGQNVTLYSVRLDARYLTKIPDHMAIVVGEEAISYNDLVGVLRQLLVGPPKIGKTNVMVNYAVFGTM